MFQRNAPATHASIRLLMPWLLAGVLAACTGATPGGSAADLDSDGDGVNNSLDQCPGTAAGATVSAQGCSLDQLDSDNDGVSDDADQCPGTAAGTPVAINGCPIPDNDADRDSVADDTDQCPDTPSGQTADANGCSDSQLDSDDDGLSDAVDQCPATPAGETPDASGCSASQRDSDTDGVSDALDQCPGTPATETADANGCSPSQLDDDADGVNNGLDQCPATPTGETADAIGCSSSQRDTDGDGVTDNADVCPLTPQSDIDAGNVNAEGCGASQIDDNSPTQDSDGDGVNNDADDCPGTPASDISANTVDADGCGASQRDGDGDNVSDAADLCPATTAGYTVDSDGCSARQCHEGISTAMASCYATVLSRTDACYQADGTPCAADDAETLAAIGALQSAIPSACPKDSLVQDAGYGPSVTRAALAVQLESSCLREPASLIARSYGGPQADLLAKAKAEGPTGTAKTACLSAAYDAARTQITDSFAAYAACSTDPDCALRAETTATAGEAQSTTANSLTQSCAGNMQQIQGSTPEIFAQRAALQTHCMVAAAHGDTSNVDLNCGPDNVLFSQVTITEQASGGTAVADVDAIPLGTPVYVEMDTAAWGTRCGSGAPYGFVMRLSPSAEHLDKIILNQEGGGVCLAGGGDCTQRPQSLFVSSDNNADDLGNDRGFLAVRDDNPLKDWSALFQPYCTQDLHIGGGGEEAGGRQQNGGILYRYGAINVRASTQFYRDLLWRKRKYQSVEGYTPDQPRVIYSGTSAGGYGVQYNLHHPLDEMQWENTLADNHAAFTIEGGSTDLALLFTSLGKTWATRPFQPPYCLEDECSLSAVNHPRHASRMGKTPFQQFLVTSAQHDSTQESTQGFPGPAAPPVPVQGQERKDWINKLREDYCQLKGTPNLYFHLGANTVGTHVVMESSPRLFDDSIRVTRELLVDGVSMLSLLADMAHYPESAIDRVEEGPTLDGVLPFSCDLTPAGFDGDSDADGVINGVDICAGTPAGAVTAANGCPVNAATDTDADGISDTIGLPRGPADSCPNTPANEAADEFGCSASQRDTDGDGFVDAIDECPGTPNGTYAIQQGCVVDGLTHVNGEQTRYDFSNRCFALRSAVSGQYVAKSGNSYAASTDSAEGAERFFFKPTKLGQYLLYDGDRQLLAANAATSSGTAIAGAGAANNWAIKGIADAVSYPSSPSYDTAPTPQLIADYRGFQDPLSTHGAFKLVNTDTVPLSLSTDASGAVRGVPTDSAPAAESFVIESATGCEIYPEASSNVSGETPTGLPPSFSGTTDDGRVLGMADVHVHISATTFLGRSEWGAPFHAFGVPHALDDCNEYHGEAGEKDVLGAAYAGDQDGHLTTGWPTFPEWPTRSSLTHEAIYWKWLERAWQGGLRVAVNDLVENATLCELSRGKAPPEEAALVDCNEMVNAKNQAGSMYAMQDYIDAQYGGRGKGFFQIVHSPAEARAVIEKGQLAVVLGIEVSNLVNCQVTYNNPARQQQPFEESGMPQDGGVTYGCTRESIAADLEELWGLGVRQVISIHEFDNAFGGNGIFDGQLLNLGNRENSGGNPTGPDPTDPFAGNPQAETPSGEFWTTYDCPVEGPGGLDNDGTPFTGYLWGGSGGSKQEFATSPNECFYSGQGASPTGPRRPGGTIPCYPDRNQCNARWMTPIGLYFYSQLMERGFIFDFDHMEYEMKYQALELAEAQDPPYPFVSTHGTFGGISLDQARRVLKNGGHLFPSIGGSNGFLNDMQETYRDAYVPAFAGVAEPPLFGFGFGTDTNGLSSQSGPRGGANRSARPIDYTNGLKLFSGGLWDQLPDFNSIPGLIFEQPATSDPDGLGRTWHEDQDGNAQYGMLADLVYEITLEAAAETTPPGGLTAPQKLQTLFNAAEAYLQTWEKTWESQQGILAKTENDTDMDGKGNVVVPDNPARQLLREAPVSPP